MRKILMLVSLSVLSMTSASAQTDAPPTSGDNVIKNADGNALMWEVPEKGARPSPPTPPDAQRIRQQAQQNQAEIMYDLQRKNTLPPMNNGTAPGAITPAYVPFSTVAPPGFRASGRVWTPFSVRDYSYSGTSQSFGAPMFSGVEVPGQVFTGPVMPMPIGVRPGLPPLGAPSLAPQVPQNGAPAPVDNPAPPSELDAP